MLAHDRTQSWPAYCLTKWNSGAASPSWRKPCSTRAIATRGISRLSLLSYIRENADKYEACRKAEVLRPMLLEWERHDALGWCEKRKDAEDEAITRLRTVIIQRIHDGTIKSPSAAVLKLLHTLGAPDTYAATGEDKNRYDPLGRHGQVPRQVHRGHCRRVWRR